MQVRHLAHTLVVAGAATALAVPATAYAESVHHHDPAHDVQQVSTTGGTTTNLPKNRTADIVGLDLAFTKKHVAVTIRTRKAASSWMFGANIKTPTRIFTVLGSHDDSSTDFELLRGPNNLGKPVACPGLRHHVDVDHATSHREGPRRVHQGPAVGPCGCRPPRPGHGRLRHRRRPPQAGGGRGACHSEQAPAPRLRTVRTAARPAPAVTGSAREGLHLGGHGGRGRHRRLGAVHRRRRRLPARARPPPRRGQRRDRRRPRGRRHGDPGQRQPLGHAQPAAGGAPRPGVVPLGEVQAALHDGGTRRVVRRRAVPRLPRRDADARASCRTPTTRGRSPTSRLNGTVTGEAGINALVAHAPRRPGRGDHRRPVRRPRGRAVLPRASRSSR